VNGVPGGISSAGLGQRPEGRRRPCTCVHGLTGTRPGRSSRRNPWNSLKHRRKSGNHVRRPSWHGTCIRVPVRTTELVKRPGRVTRQRVPFFSSTILPTSASARNSPCDFLRRRKGGDLVPVRLPALLYWRVTRTRWLDEASGLGQHGGPRPYTVPHCHPRSAGDSAA